MQFLSMNKKKKIGLVSLGCPKNRVDSEVILGDIRDKGFQVISDESKAEIIIVNTCGFIDAAREESVETILRMAEHKKNGSCETLVVTGCLSQKYREELLTEIPEIDLLFGTSNLALISKILKKQRDSQFNGDGKKNWVDDPDMPPENGENRFLTTSRHSAYLKISEGCSNWCTFCIIPELRGKYRSRPLDSIRKEAVLLAKRGVKEVNVVSQDTALYGNDLGYKKGLCQLLKELEQIEGIEWIRLLYCRPSLVDHELIETMALSEKICSYIDLPIQHSHDEMLESMGRGETEADIRKLVEKLRKAIPEITIRSELIVGFPGEKKKHFEHLMEFVREVEFDRLGVFTYSREEGTASAGMSGQLAGPVKMERMKKIMKLQETISLRKNRKLIGSIQKVLIDGFGHSWGTANADRLPLTEGRLASQAPEIDGVVYLDKSRALPGDLTNVRIQDAGKSDFIGNRL